MKLWTWLGARRAGRRGGAGPRLCQPRDDPGMVAHSRLPHVEPNHAVTWDEGPAAPPAGGRRRRTSSSSWPTTWATTTSPSTAAAWRAARSRPPTSIPSATRASTSPTATAGNATCAPSRAAIMTGRYPTRFGFEFTPAPVAFEKMVGTEAEPGAIVKPKFFKDRLTQMPPGSTAASPAAVNMLAVPGSEITIAEVLKAQGYHTLHFGKWHLGGVEGLAARGPGLRREPGLHRRRLDVPARARPGRGELQAALGPDRQVPVAEPALSGAVQRRRRCSRPRAT